MFFLLLVVLEIIVFAILVLLMRLYFSKNLSTATAHLSELSQDYNAKLDEAKRKLQEADKYYDETILKAKTDTENFKAQILKEARHIEDEILGGARKQSGEIIEQANRARELILKEVEEKIEDAAVVKASELVEAILPQEISREMHERWFGELVKNGLDTLKRLNLPENVEEAKVVSAYPLTADEREVLEKKMKTELGRSIEISESVNPILIAGIHITIGSVLIDGSLKFRIQEAVRHARSQIAS